MESTSTQSRKWYQVFTGSRGRNLREYITAYLMIAPSITLIFLFGIFPVVFALYVSLHKWRIKRGDFIGIQNYIKAVDNLAYVAMFALGIGALFGAYFLFRRILANAREHQERPWLLAIPGAIYTATVVTLVNWLFRQLPEILDIGEKVVGVVKTRSLFIQLLGDAFRAESVRPAAHWLLSSLLAAIVVGVIAHRLWPISRNLTYQSDFGLAILSFVAGVLLLLATFTVIVQAYEAAVESGEDPGIVVQLITIVVGILFLYFGWKLWKSSEAQVKNSAFFLRIFGALVLMTGAVLLIMYVPMAGASGDKDMWLGLKVTAMYSIGTVPFQLAISMFFAILLFQKLRGSEFFRILFFLPYITPAVASAAVFRQMFSNRLQAPVNAILKMFGVEAQQWLREPDGIFHMIADSIGVTLPDWAGGPSMALVVIIIYSIWTFVGYDIVIYLAGLGNIPTEAVEAAEIDGASKWQIFRHITFPLLSPTTYFLSLISIIGTFKAFNHIWVMRLGEALGTTDTFSVVIFSEFFEKYRFGYSSALAFVLFAIILILTYVNNQIQGSRVFYG
ncbi:MAG: sugar ABC transporter permease [Anaerolineales bacterium]